MKTKTITITIPESQRLGQAIMNAFRHRNTSMKMFVGGREIDAFQGGIDIWEKDEEEIQAAIDKYFSELGK